MDGINTHSENAVTMLEDINKICRAEANRKEYLGVAAMLDEYRKKPISSLVPSVTIPMEERQLIHRYADMYSIKLEDNFFDLGDLKKEPAELFQNKPERYIGSKLSVRKYEKFHSLLEDMKYFKAIKINTEIFAGCYMLNLLIHNESKETVNGISVKFTLPNNMLYLAEDLCRNDIELLHELRNADTLNEMFAIHKHPEYLAYHEITNEKMTGAHKFFIYDYDKDYYRDLWNDRHEAYFIRKVNDGIYVELKFDVVPGNTTVAFPTALPLKDKISSLSYEIVAASPCLAVEGKIATEE